MAGGYKNSIKYKLCKVIAILIVVNWLILLGVLAPVSLNFTKSLQSMTQDERSALYRENSKTKFQAGSLIMQYQFQ
jgi:hypothetical protein